MFQAQTLTVSKLRLIRREHKSRQEILRVSLDCLLTRQLFDISAEVRDTETLVALDGQQRSTEYGTHWHRPAPRIVETVPFHF